MKEQFVTYEIALELKKLGFNEKCLTGYNTSKVLLIYFPHDDFYGYCNIEEYEGSTNHIEEICAPLWQQVIDWFRKKHDVHIMFSINPYSTDINQVYGYKIYADNNLSGLKCVINYECLMLHFIEAIERAILTAIELCKQ